MAKGYTLNFDYVLYKMSYANTIMYSSVLPSYDDVKESEDQKTLNADDPRNREAIRKALYE